MANIKVSDDEVIRYLKVGVQAASDERTQAIFRRAAVCVSLCSRMEGLFRLMDGEDDGK